MLKNLLAAAAVLLCACQGAEGPEGPQGPAGQPGSPGPGATGRIVWKDATGSVVSYDTPMYVDSNGYQWTLDPETARPLPTTAALYYAQAACAGTEYVQAVLPRVPVRFEGDLPADFYFRPDTLQSQAVTVLSMRSTAQAACQAASLTLPHAIVRGQLHIARPAQEPAWAFVPPLRTERLP
jgi:hypothetical protein